ncbi:pyruvate dehydrogenase (acetyl-transferring) E1 component subunit alpha [Candidatus Nitrospira neomarina]|uniref:Pyruvate dehydrogenase E1 component subunit alpha n=1 Tax=Candidatus Nitrospira neomarina TaxID=3020899 RepID=A0AA96GLD5_9BACT|nr:pyruvate dehydrogenase (acetyl-transferring) E1 component subunit alpha [Candidatus Nitrospira neomarina]WNM64116.1 pyruvate dehydrogenase (acetyl-transferring) E1 component subunit alpha [Candidatus Nitrospira neomarina]
MAKSTVEHHSNKNDFLTLYRDMLLIRRFEEKSAEMYALAKIAGFLHLYIGQEAVAVGCMHAIRPDDYVITSYRDHGHCLAKGSDPKNVMAELFGKATGLCKGKGGSMHLIDVERHFMGGYAIVGGHLPLAVGLAFASRYRKEDRVVLCFFGDGAVPSGHTHEAFNLAALWKLPVIFICENNRYGMGTPVEREMLLYKDIAERARAHGIEAEQVDGMDVLAVKELTAGVVKKLRKEPQPYFIEASTYRFMGHSMSDPAHGHYRTKEEVGEARKQDPLIFLKSRILQDGLATEADFKQMDKDVIETVTEAVKFADESPFPEPGALHEDVLVE